MATFPASSEIIELRDEMDHASKMNRSNGKHHLREPFKKYSIEDEINKLFAAIDIRSSRRFGDAPGQDALNKSAMKRPMRASPSHTSSIGISEPVSLKQALRGLSISQASEMAAVKKRLSKPSALIGVSGGGAMKRLYNAVVVEASSSHPFDESKGSLMEITIVPERNALNISDKASEFGHSSVAVMSNETAQSSTNPAELSKEKVDLEVPMSEVERRWQLKPLYSSVGTSLKKKLPVLDEIIPVPDENSMTSDGPHQEQDTKLHSSPLSSGGKSTKPSKRSLRLSNLSMRSQSVIRKKNAPKTYASSNSSQYIDGVNTDPGSRNCDLDSQTPDASLKIGCKESEKISPASISNTSLEVCSDVVDAGINKHDPTSGEFAITKGVSGKVEKRIRSREKGEISQSSKSSIGEHSSTTSNSSESYLSGSCRSGNRPHMSKDLRWKAIRCFREQHGSLGLRHFKLLSKLGGGDIGTVYLCELIGTNCHFAVKVMDIDFLASRKKIMRAQTEKEILQMLDHPFLPTLYADFATNNFSCLVMDYCPGGDLHVLRQKQPSKNFSEQAARFYVAEILLALEYLHMLGVVYRDLKPENVLVREDGHIMLSDFDLSFRCAASPLVLKSSSPIAEPSSEMPDSCSDSSCSHPFCLDHSWQVSCFTPRFQSAASKKRKLKSELAAQIMPLPQLIVEPTSARSNSFVGTHEYLAPEIIKGEGHGSAVDWWTFGIFLYELLYGRTPFKGSSNEDTLSNVVSQCLKFPPSPMVSPNARDLIRRLLKKEPESRLGSEKGAAEIKQHPFFEGLNLALIRCETPPELPRIFDLGNFGPDITSQDNSNKCQTVFECSGDDIEFEMF